MMLWIESKSCAESKLDGIMETVIEKYIMNIDVPGRWSSLL
jgi:hypothetical protein